MTDKELIALFHTRSEEAVPVLTTQYGPYCRAIAAQLLSDRRDVDECLNDVWLAVWRAIPPAWPEHFKGWLAAIVRNRALALGQENSRRPPTVDDAALELASCLPLGNDPLGEAESRALTDAVVRFLRAQPRDVRTVFLRRFTEGTQVKQDTYTAPSGLTAQILEIIYPYPSSRKAVYKAAVSLNGIPTVITAGEGPEARAALLQVLDSFVISE